MRYRLFFKSSSKSSIVSLSTPAEPAFALTAFQASYTSSLGMTNGFDALTHLLLLPVGFEVQRLDACRGRGAACAVPPHGSGLAAFPGEWREGISPSRSLRTVREPLDSYGSHHPVVF